MQGSWHSLYIFLVMWNKRTRGKEVNPRKFKIVWSGRKKSQPGDLNASLAFATSCVISGWPLPPFLSLVPTSINYRY